MERKAFTSLMEASARVLLGETHMVGKTVIVKGKKGKVVKQVSSDGKTESDEIYQVKFEDGSIEDIPARDMEMQGDIENRKEPSENEAEDIVNEGHDCAKIHPNMSHKEWKKTQKESVELDEGIWKDTGKLVKKLIRNPGMKAPKKGDPDFKPMFTKRTTPRTPEEEQAALDFYTRQGKPPKKIFPRKKKNESVELDEGRMKEIDIRRKEGETPEQIAQGMKVKVKDIKKVLIGRKVLRQDREKKESVEIEEGGKDVVKIGKPITIGLDIKNPIGDKMNKERKKKLKANEPPSQDLLDTITKIVTDYNTRAIHKEEVELEESYDKKGLLKKDLTHAVHSKGSDGQIHFTTRSKKMAQFKAKMYTDAIQWTKKTHPGFDIKIVPHGTPNGKSVHKDHERYYGKTDESVEVDESLGGPGGPSRQMSPSDMYKIGLPYKKKTPKTPKTPKYHVKYSKTKKGEGKYIQVAKFMTHDKAKAHLSDLNKQGYKGIINKEK